LNELGSTTIDKQILVEILPYIRVLEDDLARRPGRSQYRAGLNEGLREHPQHRMQPLHSVLKRAAGLYHLKIIAWSDW
jgi:hypothetical protein